MNEKFKRSYAVNNVCEIEKIEIELLLEGMYRHYGFDFRNYAFSSIRRRIWHRIKGERLDTITSLLNRILHDPKAMERLFLDFSINVTEMFRDPSFFKILRNQILPCFQNLSTIRIWHAGCSTGEEAYSMAILLKEVGVYEKARIYATDMNYHVIQQAKTGKFPLKKMKDYTGNYVHSGGVNDFSEYYSVKDEYAFFNPELSKNIIFAQHNLVTDGSFNEFHLIVCRNVLIYFDQTLQKRVHKLFLGSLCHKGVLALGNREGLSFPNKEQYYEILNEENKIFRRM